ncbi:ABC transporter ATP-binding protein [Chelativorans sp. AA-79]|uniref:ABC transporter ATP-binding protein n=1 Tax=Chelativorans sp. AA-79 TaxID=3028735 RepID=UPI0023F7B618|nr:ABC transporter ATP-binding protein [Chelativorans sp. AA-79]WEX07209.1 ABC transporter ATP-binding protein [Chelativorans sp. AA-79]
MNDLELIGVGKTYPDGTVAVSDFDLAVKPGEFVAFLGPSGCGKSTTLRMIAGFEKISHGDILIKGRNVSATPPEKRPTSMIFQNYALFPHMTVRQNIGFGLDVKGLSAAEKKAKTDRIMDMFGLSGFADRKADRLSGGQRQRIALARGLVVEPDILLLDEPLGALDANLRRVIQNELKLLQRELGITFVFVTHAQSEALGLSDRIVVMNRGRVEQVGTPYEVYTSPATEFVARFIGSNAIIEGANLKVQGDMAVVDTAFGRMRGRYAASVSSGASVLVAIPAEAMRIQPANAAPATGENRFQGTVSMKHAVGSIGHVKVALDGRQSVDVQTGTDDEALMRLAIGDAVVVDCPSDRVTLVGRG